MRFKIFLFLLLTVFAAAVPGSAQIAFDFDDMDLSAWSGDLDDFIVNDDLKLQLNASEAGNSILYATIPMTDSLVWSMDIEMDFAPSTSNFLDVWLHVDDITSATPSGRLLRFGESGSVDAIRFFSVISGDETLLAAGNMAQIANGVDLTVSISKSGTDEWVMKTDDPSDTAPPTEAFRFQSPTEVLTGNMQFGFICKYSSTRTDKFFFDNINIQPLLPDTEKPTLLSAIIQDPQKILLQFDEAMDSDQILDLNAYEIQTEAIETVSVAMVSSSVGRADLVCLELNTAFPSGRTGTISVNGLTDIAGNIMNPATFNLALAVAPFAGDIYINEILYDPISGSDVDFVEIINASSKLLKLDSVFFSRANSTARDVQIQGNLMMLPGEIIAFSDDVAEIEDIYDPIETAHNRELNITNYVNDEGNVSVLSFVDGQRITLDSFDYSNDLHSELLTSDSREGVSLERLSVLSPTNDDNNWFSAASISNYGTPGYENSQQSAGDISDEIISLESKVLSPDGDGYEDFLRINYKLDKTGYIGNIAIYDDHGRLETHLMENQLLGTEGAVIWEGTLADGSVAPIGMYILRYDIFHNDGDVISGKKVCVVAQRL